jgi:hypothetical protein
MKVLKLIFVMVLATVSYAATTTGGNPNLTSAPGSSGAYTTADILMET